MLSKIAHGAPRSADFPLARGEKDRGRHAPPQPRRAENAEATNRPHPPERARLLRTDTATV